MYFANPWGLLGLLALPTIIVLHLFHRRFPPRLVGGLHLWGVEQRIPLEGRRRDTLPLSPSLLLELLAALLLTLLLSQPRFSDPKSVQHFIVVLDNSASMAAVGGDDLSARDRTLGELRQLVEPFATDARVTLIGTGRRPALVAGPAEEWTAGQTKLDSWQPELPDHSPLPALDLAIQLAEDGGRVLFLTDQLPPTGQPPTETQKSETTSNESNRSTDIPEAVEVIAGGLPVANLAITSAHWSLDPQTLTGSINVRVANLGPRQQSATIRGTVAGQTVFESRVDLKPQARIAQQAPVPGGVRELTVSLNGDDDGLALDSAVTLIEPRLRSVRVRLDFANDDPRRIDVLRVLNQIPTASLSSSDANLSIGPEKAPSGQTPGQWRLNIGPFPASATDAVKPQSTEPAPATVDSQPATSDLKGVTVAGPYLIDKRNPLLEGVQLDGVVWGGVQQRSAAEAPLISCGSLPLLIQRSGDQMIAFDLNVDLAQSNLTESPDWPILLSNLVALRQQALPGLNRWNFRVNEDVRFRIAPAALATSSAADPAAASSGTMSAPVALQLIHNGTSKTISTLGSIELPAIDRAGTYTLKHGNQVIERFAVNFFDRSESNLLDRESGRRPPIADDPQTLLLTDSPTNWLILAALLTLLAVVLSDWFVVRRRSAESLA